jgi:phosphotransferase system enzyme I (PtsI)
MVVGLTGAKLEGHSEAIIDGEAGTAVLSPGPNERRLFDVRLREFQRAKERESAYLRKPAITADGVLVEVLINVAGVDELDRIDTASCDGIGLMRSEFLFRDGEPLPDEEMQYRAYRRFLEWAGDKPVTIRTLDIGGDKPIRGLTRDGERNPFLGLRGVRLTLAHPEIYRTQLRALARAAVHGNLKIMVPMVTVPEELRGSAQLLDSVFAELSASGIPARLPPVGMMVEVPAAAIAPEIFTEAAFFSIGSNDLTQYVTAASRDDPKVSHLNDPGHPAVLRLIQSVVGFARAQNLPVSLCGDMASDPQYLAALLKTGLRTLSVAPAALGQVKASLASIKVRN